MRTNFLLAALSGLLLVLMHPGFNISVLAPFALTPLLIALAREWRPKYRFLLGYTTGAIFWGGMCYWIQYVIAVHGQVGEFGGWLIFFLYCLIPSLNTAMFGLLAGIVIQRPHAIPFLAALWVASERIPTLFNFMWLKLGNAAIDMGLLLRLAPYLGVYGISFLFALLAAALAWVILKQPRRELAWLSLLVFPFIFPELPAPQRGSEIAVSVQPNVPEEKEWTRADADALQDRMLSLSLQTALSETPRPKLILWPEAPAPIYYFDDPELQVKVAQLARLTNAYVIVSTVGHAAKNEPMNSAVMVSPAGEVVGRYDKIFPVPFGEYVPEPFGYFAGKVTDQIGDFQAGEKVSIMGAHVGTFICYESAFPHLVRQFAANGATVYANLSNDGYFGHSAAREQHLALVRMRAVENRRWILRSTNDGTTASVDPAGHVVEIFPSYVETVGRLPYTDVADTTPYTRYGDWFAWLCVAASAAGLALSQVPHYEKPKAKALRK